MKGANYRVVLDACVLANHGVCDLFLRLAERPRLYSPKWSQRILEEASQTGKECPGIRFSSRPGRRLEPPAAESKLTLNHFKSASLPPGFSKGLLQLIPHSLPALPLPRPQRQHIAPRRILIPLRRHRLHLLRVLRRQITPLTAVLGNVIKFPRLSSLRH